MVYTLDSAVHITVELYICTCLQSRMYRNNARDGRDIVSARQKRYISEKCSKMRVLKSLKSGPLVKIRFGFRGFLRDTLE